MEDNFDPDALIGEAFAENPMQFDAPATASAEPAPAGAPQGGPGPAATAPDAGADTPAQEPTAAPATPSAKTYTADEWAAMEGKLDRASKSQSAEAKRAADLAKQVERLTLEKQSLELGYRALANREHGAGPEDVASEYQKATGFAQQQWDKREKDEADDATATADSQSRAELALKERVADLTVKVAEKGLTGLDLRAMVEERIKGDDDLKTMVALTWEPISQERRTELVRTIYDTAEKRVLGKVDEIVAAKAKAQAPREQFDRSTAVGAAPGGRQPLPEFTSVTDDINDFYAAHPLR